MNERNLTHSKGLRGIILGLVMMLSFFIMQGVAHADDEYVIGGKTQTVELTTYDGSEIEIFGLNSDYADVLTVPENRITALRFTENGNKVTNISYSFCTSTTDDGVLTAAYTVYYWKNGIGSTAYIEDYTRIERDVREGAATLTVKGTSTYSVKVRVTDYANRYADDVIDEFIADNITDSMTEVEKGRAALNFVADNYNYDYHYYTALGMLIHGGGDCWASTAVIKMILDKLGIENWIRNANMDPGSGSGHRNLMAVLDGDYYILDAGYSGKAPRSRSMSKRESLFSFNSTSYNGVSGYSVYQYDGKEAPEVLEIPATYNGKPVIGIAASFRVNAGSTGIKELVIPDSVMFIGRNAINSWSSLEKLNFPAALVSVGELNFTNCTALQNINIAAGNTSFSYSKGVLYDYAKTKIIKAPNVASVSIPDTVTTIGAYAFYYNKNIEKISLPSSVTTIEAQAFADCDKLSSIKLSDNITSLPQAVLASCDILTEVKVPAKVTLVDELAFAQSKKLERIYFTGDKPEFGEDSLYQVSADVYYSDSWAETPSADVTAGSVNWIPVAELKITTQPSNRKVKEGLDTSFSVAASGTELKYQWQVSTDGGETWKSSGLTGAKTKKLTLNAPYSRNGYFFRCVVTDVMGRKETSNPAKLTVVKGLTMSAGPSSLYAKIGETACFSVSAAGYKLSYQWQASKDGGKTWSNSSLSGNKTAKLSVPVTAARNTYLFRCIVKDGRGNTATTDAAELTVYGIKTQPANVTVAEDTTAKFTVAAMGSGLTYQWQASTDAGKNWKNSGLTGNKTNTLKVKATGNRHSYRFRCIIKDDKGHEIVSNYGMLTVK